MKRIFKKDQILTIPNLLSALRIVMIPVIVWLYCVKKAYTPAVLVIALSGLTDILDGFIARKCNMISDFGKILDPVADKLTQAALVFCLIGRYKLMIPLIVLFAVKELGMATMGLVAVRKKDSINGAKWYGKVNTVLLYIVMILLILFPGIPDTVANVMIICCMCMLVFSFVGYAIFYRKLFSQKAE